MKNLCKNNMFTVTSMDHVVGCLTWSGNTNCQMWWRGAVRFRLGLRRMDTNYNCVFSSQ